MGAISTDLCSTIMAIKLTHAQRLLAFNAQAVGRWYSQFQNLVGMNDSVGALAYGAGVDDEFLIYFVGQGGVACRQCESQTGANYLPTGALS